MAQVTALEKAIASALYQTVGQEIGLVARTNDTARLRPLIYRVRQTIADPLLDQVQIRTSPTNPSTDFWFIRLAEPSVLEPESPPHA